MTSKFVLANLCFWIPISVVYAIATTLGSYGRPIDYELYKAHNFQIVSDLLVYPQAEKRNCDSQNEKTKGKGKAEAKGKRN